MYSRGSCMQGCMSGLFAVIGMILTLIAIFLAIYSMRVRAISLRTPGTIIRMVQRRDDEDGSISNFPVVSYQVEGKAYEIQGAVSSSAPVDSIGRRITVLYPPNHPEQGRIDTFLEQWFVPLLLGFIGIVFGLIGVLGVLFGRR